MNLQLSDHARTRQQQRSIPVPVLDCLLTYGRRVHDHHGCSIVFFDHHAREKVRRALSKTAFKKVEGKLDAYAVVAGDGLVVTVGHRTMRINRH